ncbi:MAG: exonuclease SbcCD subunit D [Dehalococcoidia bacterium]|nr:exonuclease SbcCD subunit D [Dehalococcoidia bacterium]
MKILHFSDLHLGVEAYGALDPETGLHTRLLDFLKVLDQVINHALENRVDLVLFCGDAYKSREPSQTQQREFARRLQRLAAADIPVFLLAGNHDLPNAAGRASAVEIFQTLSVKNISVASKPDIHLIQTASGPLQVAALPWARRSLLLSKEENKSLTFQQTNERLQEIMTRTIRNFADSIDPQLPSVLAAHLSISTAVYGSEKTTMVGQDPVLLPSSIFQPAFDYIALGHLHRHQVLSDRPCAAYSGSLERIDFSEEKEEKGFCVVEIENSAQPEQRKTHLTFHPVQARRFLTISVEIREQDLDPTATVLQAIARRAGEIKEAVVRLQLSLPAQAEGKIRDSELRKALGEAHYILPFAFQISGKEPRIRLREWQGAEGLTPEEALKAYLKLKQYSPERAQVLLQYGERLLREYQSKQE